MYLFREYVEYRLMEAEIPMPPELSPEEQQLWSNESWRKFWLMQHPDYLKNLQSQQPAAPAQKPGLTIGQRPAAFGQKAAARALGPVAPQAAARALTPAYQGASDINNAIRTYLSRLQGMPNEGSLDALKAVDMPLATAITQAIQNRAIDVQKNRSATFGFKGVNFFYDKNGKIGFIVNR